MLLALRDLGKLEEESGRRGLDWLVANRCTDGGWGSCASNNGAAEVSSVEETALALEALLADYATPSTQPAIEQGVEWLTAAVGEGRHRESSPIGFYFAKLWYYERMYPLTFTVSALGRAVRCFAPDAD